MTREEARKAAEIMLAYANGEEIESLWFGEYVPCETPNFNWIDGKGVENYRIKPKEKFGPKDLKPFDKVLVRDTNSQNWGCDLFSNIDNRGGYPYICVSGAYNMVIPYNDETKHLVGTNDDAPEFYRYWEK